MDPPPSNLPDCEYCKKKVLRYHVQCVTADQSGTKRVVWHDDPSVHELDCRNAALFGQPQAQLQLQPI